MDRRRGIALADPDRPVGEKLRSTATTEVLQPPNLKDAFSLGARLQRANPATANKTNIASKADQKSEIEQLDLVQILKSIGTTVKGKYVKDPMCLLALRHMARHIRDDRHNDKLTVRLHLVRAGLTESNLVPLLLTDADDFKLWEIGLNIMYELTISPAIILKTFPKDKVEDSTSIRMHLREYDDGRQVSKKLFMDPAFFKLLCGHLNTVLHSEDRSKEQTNFVGNALRLLRNIFEMRGETERGFDQEAPALVHDKVFCALDQSGITAILLWLASADDEEDFVLDVLEVIHALLFDFDPEALGKTARPEKDLHESDAAIKQLRQREEAIRKAASLKAASRHSTFGGSFTVKGSKAVDPTNEVVLIKSVSSILNNKFELTADKQAQAKARNKRPMKAVVERTKAPSGGGDTLRNFCHRFLTRAYNTFMQTSKSSVEYVPSEEADEHHSRYFWALRFFSAFARVSETDVQFISQTVSVESFHFVHSKLESYSDSLQMDKQQIALWSNRAHTALRAYQELLLILSGMMTSTEPSMIRAAEQIEMNLFYVQEYREIFFKLLREFNEVKYSRSYLKDLVMTVHIFLKLLEVYLQKQKHLFVMKKKRAKKSTTDVVDPVMKELGDIEMPEDVENSDKDKGFKEVEFDLVGYIKRFAAPSHLEPYLLLLRDYVSNIFPVNHAVLKMLHRIAVDLDLPGMLFQISLFRLYHRLIKQANPTGDLRFQSEFRQFMQFILGKFFDKMREDPKTTVLSVMFWKTRNEAYELVEGPMEKPPKRPGADKMTDFERQQVDAGRADVVPLGRREESPDDDGDDAFTRLRHLDAARESNSVSPDREALVSRKSKKTRKVTSDSSDTEQSRHNTPRKPADMLTSHQRRLIEGILPNADNRKRKSRKTRDFDDDFLVDNDDSSDIASTSWPASLRTSVSPGRDLSVSSPGLERDYNAEDDINPMVIRRNGVPKREIDAGLLSSDDEESRLGTQRKKARNIMESDDEDDASDGDTAKENTVLSSSKKRFALIEDDDDDDPI